MAQNILIIGAVALGPKAASRFKRLEPESTVTMIDKGSVISYGGCGIPYFVGGQVENIGELRETSAHVVRDPVFFDKPVLYCGIKSSDFSHFHPSCDFSFLTCSFRS